MGDPMGILPVIERLASRPAISGTICIVSIILMEHGLVGGVRNVIIIGQEKAYQPEHTSMER